MKPIRDSIKFYFIIYDQHICTMHKHTSVALNRLIRVFLKHRDDNEQIYGMATKVIVYILRSTKRKKQSIRNYSFRKIRTPHTDTAEKN